MTSEAATKPPLAVVTGASSGFGEAFARRLAKDGYDLVLVARRKGRLEALAAELAAAHGTNAEPFVADLSDDAQIARVEERVRREPVDLLINNAGFLEPADFAEGDVDRWDALVHVRLVSMVRLTHAALAPMLARRRGAVINMASIGAFVPLPRNAVYCGVKRFVVAFTESLSIELHGTGVRVQALCPGWTQTDLLDDSELDTSHIPRSWRSEPEDVVDASLRALKRGKLIVIPGWRNKLLVFGTAIAYRPFLRWFTRAFRFNQADAKS